MNDLAFADAARPTPPRILRLPLLPYSIGHELLLQAARNPILGGPEFLAEFDPAQRRKAILRAVLVCSRNWSQNRQPERWLSLWDWTIRRHDTDLSIAEFRAYRDAGSSCPEIKPSDNGDGRPLGAPLMARLLSFSAARFGAAAYDQPLGMLQWMFYAWAEFKGACRVENATERQIREEIAEHQAQYAREQEAKCLR